MSRSPWDDQIEQLRRVAAEDPGSRFAPLARRWLALAEKTTPPDYPREEWAPETRDLTHHVEVLLAVHSPLPENVDDIFDLAMLEIGQLGEDAADADPLFASETVDNALAILVHVRDRLAADPSAELPRLAEFDHRD